MRLQTVVRHISERLAVGTPLLPPRLAAAARGQDGGHGARGVPQAVHGVRAAGAQSTQELANRSGGRLVAGPCPASLDPERGGALLVIVLRRLLREGVAQRQWRRRGREARRRLLNGVAHVPLQSGERLTTTT